jgi:hypothetical protein
MPQLQVSPAGQTEPQAPQLSGSFSRFVRTPLQTAGAAAQAAPVQTPLTQDSPEAQSALVWQAPAEPASLAALPPSLTPASVLLLPPSLPKKHVPLTQVPPLPQLASVWQPPPPPPQIPLMQDSPEGQSESAWHAAGPPSERVLPPSLRPPSVPGLPPSTPIAPAQIPQLQAMPLGQALPHPPQFWGSLMTLVLTPPHETTTPVQPASPGPGPPSLAPLQTPLTQAWPDPQSAFVRQAVGPASVPEGVEHVPPEQLAPLAQTLPQLPQLSGSMSVFVQPEGQEVSPAMQVLGGTQVAPTQLSPLGQTDPQPPQLSGSVCVSVQLPPQLVSPEAQGPASGAVLGHAPLVQLAPLGQALPQAPQLAESVARSVQLLPQAVWPVAQVRLLAQAPFTQ